ncbi:MAG TPA: hypothetical protein VGP90_04900, partial [Acidimicrobiia bacterium]|nr:hypothetical protein [Acidimicrobiia bacterium]
MADRHDDELAERRAGGARPQSRRGSPPDPRGERGAGGAATAGGALPLQWAEPADEPPVEDAAPSLLEAEEADCDALADD